MPWKGPVPKKAVRCINNEISIILSEIELDKNLIIKLKDELVRYVEANIDRYAGKHPLVPTKYLARTLAEDADYIEENYVIPLKEYLDSLNHIEESYSDSSELFYPDF
jgi:hypothetical protein